MFDGVRERGEGRGFEKSAQGQLDIKTLARGGEQARREQLVAAELEKVDVGRHAVER